ncbi:WIF1 family protein [Megaselia abdita]
MLKRNCLELIILPLFLLFAYQPEGRVRNSNESNRNRNGGGEGYSMGLYLWLTEHQPILIGYPLRIYGIHNGTVMDELKPNFNNFLPIIPTEVNTVNFTWRSGKTRYNYTFDRLESSDDTIIDRPYVSINTSGRIPKREKSFALFIPCTMKAFGVASFTIGLHIHNARGVALEDTPLLLKFRKECMPRGVPDGDCKLKCLNGECDASNRCACKFGYVGQFCQTALCYPNCMHGGNCTAPAKCTCPTGYQGNYCEGGICSEKCLNGGKCIQKDKCQCAKGYYGNRCEFSRCTIPCANGTKCIGNNKCKCPRGLSGNHCEEGVRLQRQACRKRCGKHGTCQDNKCLCQKGFYGKRCNAREKRKRY